MSRRSRSGYLLPALRIVMARTVLTGLAYPLLITAIAWTLFPWRAAGSIVVADGRAVGSVLIGQGFRHPREFWGRPSATVPEPCVALDAEHHRGSAASNLVPAPPTLLSLVRARIVRLREADARSDVTVGPPIPVDLVTASANGIDPDPNVAGARWQARRIAAVRGCKQDELHLLVLSMASRPILGVLGEPTVNLLGLALELDRRRPPR